MKNTTHLDLMSNLKWANSLVLTFEEDLVGGGEIGGNIFTVISKPSNSGTGKLTLLMVEKSEVRRGSCGKSAGPRSSGEAARRDGDVRTTAAGAAKAAGSARAREKIDWSMVTMMGIARER